MTATHPIITDNGQAETVSTEHGAGQTTPQWVRAHKGEVDDQGLVDQTVGQLETSWHFGDPPQYRFKTTVREPLETDDDFKLRHFTDVLADMANGHDPIP